MVERSTQMEDRDTDSQLNDIDSNGHSENGLDHSETIYEMPENPVSQNGRENGAESEKAPATPEEAFILINKSAEFLSETTDDLLEDNNSLTNKVRFDLARDKANEANDLLQSSTIDFQNEHEMLASIIEYAHNFDKLVKSANRLATFYEESEDGNSKGERVLWNLKSSYRKSKSSLNDAKLEVLDTPNNLSEMEREGENLSAKEALILLTRDSNNLIAWQRKFADNPDPVTFNALSESVLEPLQENRERIDSTSQSISEKEGFTTFLLDKHSSNLRDLSKTVHEISKNYERNLEPSPDQLTELRENADERQALLLIEKLEFREVDDVIPYAQKYVDHVQELLLQATKEKPSEDELTEISEQVQDLNVHYKALKLLSGNSMKSLQNSYSSKLDSFVPRSQLMLLSLENHDEITPASKKKLNSKAREARRIYEKLSPNEYAKDQTTDAGLEVKVMAFIDSKGYESPVDTVPNMNRTIAKLAELQQEKMDIKKLGRKYTHGLENSAESLELSIKAFELLSDKKGKAPVEVREYVEWSKNLLAEARIRAEDGNGAVSNEQFLERLKAQSQFYQELGPQIMENMSDRLSKLDKPKGDVEKTTKEQAEELIESRNLTHPLEIIPEINSIEKDIYDKMRGLKNKSEEDKINDLKATLNRLDIGQDAFLVLLGESKLGNVAKEYSETYFKKSVRLNLLVSEFLDSVKNDSPTAEITKRYRGILARQDERLRAVKEALSPQSQQNEPLTMAQLKPETKEERANKIIEEGGYAHPTDILSDFAKASQASTDAYEKYAADPSRENSRELRKITREFNSHIYAFKILSQQNKDTISTEIKDKMREYYNAGQRLKNINLTLLNEKYLNKRKDLMESQESQRKETLENQKEAKSRLDEVIAKDFSLLSPNQVFDRLVNNQNDLVNAMDDYKGKFNTKIKREKKKLPDARKNLQESIFSNNNIVDFVNNKMDEVPDGKTAELIGEYAYLEKRLVKLAHGLQDNLDNRILMAEIEREVREIKEEQRKISESMTNHISS